MSRTGESWTCGRQVAVSATESKHLYCLKPHIEGGTEIKRMIYWNKVLKNVRERRVKSTEGGLGLGEETHLHWRLNETERADRATIPYGMVRPDTKGRPRRACCGVAEGGAAHRS